MKAGSSVVAVALLFDDVELGGHLRAALTENGAQIAHEGPLSSFDEAALHRAGVNVLVVNLDDSVDDAALDHVYQLIESGDILVVFNDAQASRSLDGWDRARWARHLAAKVLNHSSIDPPRPEHSPTVETPAMPAQADEQASPVAAKSAEPRATPSPESETLAAELEALLASDEVQTLPENEFGSGLKYRAEDELPPLHDDDFGFQDVNAAAPHVDAPVEAEAPPPASPKFDINLDHLSLASMDEDVPPPPLEKTTLAQQTPAPEASEWVAPDWGFMEEDAATPPPDMPESSHFGIEKLSAADFLAPDATLAEGEALPIVPGMSLELVSIEEAIAPRQEYQPYEAHLQELDAAFARLLVLGAADESTPSLTAFLAALPGSLKMPILLTQHQKQESAEQLIAVLTTRCALPIKVATAGMRAKLGEIVVAPRGQQVHIGRDGRVELIAANDSSGIHSPSIDSSFTMAANVFGRDALAILFAGQATDAVAGAQAIHDRGGQVWVESSHSDHYPNMVHGVLAEHLASFSGSPHELALRLVEDFR